MSDMSDTLSIRLKPEMAKELRKVCKQQRRPASDVAREALRQYLVTTQLREVRRKLRPYAQAKGFLTDEDFFKAVS
jgi:predicted transcriptional regulator